MLAYHPKPLQWWKTLSVTLPSGVTLVATRFSAMSWPQALPHLVGEEGVVRARDVVADHVGPRHAQAVDARLLHLVGVHLRRHAVVQRAPAVGVGRRLAENSISNQVVVELAPFSR